MDVSYAPHQPQRLPVMLPGPRAAAQQVHDRVVLTPEPQSSRAARHFVRGACKRWQLDPVLESALLVVSELVTNAASYSRSAVITVRLHLLHDHLLIEVEDEDSRLPVRLDVDWDALGGRGLTIVEAVSRAWGSTTCAGGKIVWAQLSLSS